MKRTALELTLILALLISSLAGTQLINPALSLAGYPDTPDTNTPSITIQSPQNLQTYMNAVPYWITIEKPSSWYDTVIIHGVVASVGYIIDGGEKVTVADIQKPNLPSAETRVISLEGNLSGLSEGSHNFQVWVQSDSTYVNSSYNGWPLVADYTFYTYSNIVQFYIPLKVSILSIENKTYETSDVPLNYTVNTSASQITYSLDGQGNITVAGNTTLTGLANGNHNLTVYAKDAFWKWGASETMYFSVEVPKVPEVPEPFPASAVAVAFTTLAVVICVSLAVYLTKTRRTNQKTKNASSTDSCTHATTEHLSSWFLPLIH